MDDSLKQVKAKAAATYDAAADHFDDEPLGFWERIRSRTVERLALSAGANVLGCGTGASALPAAQAVGPNGIVVGVDLSVRLLDRARVKLLSPKETCGLCRRLAPPNNQTAQPASLPVNDRPFNHLRRHCTREEKRPQAPSFGPRLKS